MCLIAVVGLAGLPTATAKTDVGAVDTVPVFTAAYNLHYDRALTVAQQLVARFPDASSPHRALATVVWMQLLYDRGALTIDHYLTSLTRSDVDLPSPPADRAALFHTHVNRAIALAEARIKAAPDDVEARFEAGLAHGLRASYIATVEGKVTSAFGAARRAFDAHEWVLDKAPQRHDAGLIVGTYRYAVAAMSFPKRWFAYIAGFGGGKERGIAMLEEAATIPTTATDARLALALIYSREARQHEAHAVFVALMAEYPDNRLFQLEAASAAWRAGLADTADALLTSGLARLAQDSRPKPDGERALWLYKRGQARVSRNHLPEAEQDLGQALEHNPAGWVEGRVYLELGRIADLRGARSRALDAYARARTLCEAHRDPWCSDEAAALRKRPFRFTGNPVD